MPITLTVSASEYGPKRPFGTVRRALDQKMYEKFIQKKVIAHPRPQDPDPDFIELTINYDKNGAAILRQIVIESIRELHEAGLDFPTLKRTLRIYDEPHPKEPDDAFQNSDEKEIVTLTLYVGLPENVPAGQNGPQLLDWFGSVFEPHFEHPNPAKREPSPRGGWMHINNVVGAWTIHQPFSPMALHKSVRYARDLVKNAEENTAIADTIKSATWELVVTDYTEATPDRPG